MARRRTRHRVPFSADERARIAAHADAGGFLLELVGPMGRSPRELRAEWDDIKRERNRAANAKEAR